MRIHGSMEEFSYTPPARLDFPYPFMTTDELISIIEDSTGESDLTTRTDLASLAGWNSLAVLGFLAEIDRRFGVEMNPAELNNCDTIGDVASRLDDS